MAKYGMAIDLHRCVGCGACAIACKTENNTEIEKNGKKYNWADFYIKTDGKFSEGNLKHWVFPTLCNHCSSAPCIEVCPANPKALFKNEDGITMLNHDRCIGCGYCINHCPYSDHNVDSSHVQYSVLTRNPAHSNTHSFYDGQQAIIAGCTMSPAELAEAVEKRPPHVNEYTHEDTKAVRPKNTSEKCTFCHHRIMEGLEPYCVASCPTYGRMFGDLDDPNSEINEWLAKGYVRLRNNRGDLIGMNQNSDSEPNIYYIGFEGQVGIQDMKPSAAPAVMKLYPNPAKTQTNIELEVTGHSAATVAVFDISGKQIKIDAPSRELHPGKNSFSIDVAHLKKGTYVVRVVTRSKSYSSNLIVIP